MLSSPQTDPPVNPDPTSVVYVFHLRDERGRWWHASDLTRKCSGRLGGSKKQLLDRWRSQHGAPGKVVVYKGLHRPAEAAMTLASMKGGEV
jgi:hypothetical protein